MTHDVPLSAAHRRSRPPTAVPAGAFRRAVRWVWRIGARGVVGLPLALAAIPMALFGSGRSAARAQLAVLDRFGPPPGKGSGGTAASEPRTVLRERMGAGRVIGHSLTVLLPALVAFAVTMLCLGTAYSGYLYFLRPDTVGALDHPFSADTQLLDDAWGGPTLIGAWFVHSLVALGLHIPGLGLTRWLNGVQGRATRRILAC